MDRLFDTVGNSFGGYGFVAVALIILLLGCILVLGFHVVKSRRRRGGHLEETPGVGMTTQDLKGLQNRGLLTPEEAKKVREAMARQFLEEQQEEERRRASLPPLKGLAALALEAERAEQELAKKRLAQGGADAPPVPDRRKTPVPRASRAETPPPEPALRPAPAAEAPRLPAALEPMAAMPEAELESLVQAGFLTQEDYNLILQARG